MILENKRSLTLLINETNKFERFDDKTQRKYIADYKKYGNSNLLHKIVNNNLLFVIFKARGYIELNLPIEDMVNEGVIGLIKAINLYDHTAKTKLLSFAGFYIDKYIKLYINDFSLDLHIPYNIIYTHYKVNKVSQKFFATNGYEPEYENILEEVRKLKGKKESEQNVKDAIIFINNIKEKHESRLNKLEEVDFDKFEFTSNEIKDNRLLSSLNSLTNIEKKFIMDYYGFDSKMKFMDIAKKYRIKYDNLKKVHDRIINKMKDQENERFEF